MVQHSEFLDRVKQAMEFAAVSPTPHRSDAVESQPDEVDDPDISKLAIIVAHQQSIEPRAPRVSVPSDAWNALAADSVAAGLRRLDDEARPRKLFARALIEPTHLTALSMTAAASLVLRPGGLASWRTRAASLHHDPRAVPGLEKAGVMIGIAFPGPGRAVVEATEDPDWYSLSGVELITHAHLYDALLVRVPESDGGVSCYLIPVHTAAGQPNQLRVTKLFGRPGTAPATFAHASVEGARAIRVGPVGAGNQLFRPAIERLRADSAVVGAAQMRAAVDVLAEGLERRAGADVYHRHYTADVEATVAAAMAIWASERLSADAVAGIELCLAQHWMRSRFGATVPDASAIVQLGDRDAAPAVTWTSPLLPLWGGTAGVLRSEFATWADRGAVQPFVDRMVFESQSRVLRNAHAWLRETVVDPAAAAGDRLESAALLWAASILTSIGKADALGAVLAVSKAPRSRRAEKRDDLVIDLRRSQNRPVEPASPHLES